MKSRLLVCLCSALALLLIACAGGVSLDKDNAAKEDPPGKAGDPKPAPSESKPDPLPETLTRASAQAWARKEAVRRSGQPKLPADTAIVLHNIGILGKSKTLFYLGDPRITEGRPGAPSLSLDNATTAIILDDSDTLKMRLVWVRLTSGPHSGKEGYAQRSDVYVQGETVIDPTRRYR